ncbi:hypothetical protein JMJ77_0013022 [Colletotrichum scovillei]|uniref:Uncharacterized protein n=1 Tax=Colletotrichum scovillei TaxID=1209932 RepID=A0A9P7UI72_9PEZI|nr:hypothetical protein JMJ77_0013022 [Colletotrichum scovillei]KAG7069309.1 hypothetical protein JMJ76_0002982 [Colletotrichum scovillei]KAG7073259.1 hypothetical protein JMJ78_0014238 [Colletotrichum scovillei]
MRHGHVALLAPPSETLVRQTYGCAIVTNPDVRAGARGHRSPKKAPYRLIYSPFGYLDFYQSLDVTAEEGSRKILAPSRRVLSLDAKGPAEPQPPVLHQPRHFQHYLLTNQNL